MNDSGNGGGVYPIGERGDLMINPIPTAADCARNFLSGSDPALVVAAALIGILGRLEALTEKEVAL